MTVEEDKAHLKERIARALADHLKSGKSIEQLAPASARKLRRRAENKPTQTVAAFWPELLDTPSPEAGSR